MYGTLRRSATWLDVAARPGRCRSDHLALHLSRSACSPISVTLRSAARLDLRVSERRQPFGVSQRQLEARYRLLTISTARRMAFTVSSPDFATWPDSGYSPDPHGVCAPDAVAEVQIRTALATLAANQHCAPPSACMHRSNRHPGSLLASGPRPAAPGAPIATHDAPADVQRDHVARGVAREEQRRGHLIDPSEARAASSDQACATSTRPGQIRFDIRRRDSNRMPSGARGAPAGSS